MYICLYAYTSALLSHKMLSKLEYFNPLIDVYIVNVLLEYIEPLL